MGASSSTSIDLKPNSDEISKAVLLSSLAYLDNAERNAAFKSRYSNIGLENIVLAPDFILGECKQNNSSTLFVAFRWRFCIQDIFSLKVAGMNEFTKSYGAAGKDVRGFFHNKLFQRTTDNLPSMSYFNDFKAGKIIFAGHGLAGSLAHVFLLCYMLNTREPEAKRHISIGFGSPNFCDSDAKLFCGKNLDLDKRMYTLVNGADPVPWLLTGIRMTVTSNPEPVLERTMAEKLSSLSDRLNSWLNPANSKEKIEIKANMLESLNTFVEEIQSMQDHSRCPHYVAVGAYCKGKDLKSVNPVTGVKVTDVNAWNCHRVECYVQEFSISMKEGECPIRRIIEESGPCIDACSFNIYHGPKSHEGVIAIRGLALSERKELRVKPNVGREWKVEYSNDNSIILIRDLSKTEVAAMSIGKNDENTKQAHDLSLYLRTCFGSIDVDVQVEDAWRDSYVANSLNRAMGRLLLMQQSERLTGSDEYREAYEALDCVFRDTLDLSEKTKIEYSETVKLQLTAPVETPVPNNIFQKFKDGYNFAESAQGLPRKIYVLFSTSLWSSPANLCPVIPGNSCISRFVKQEESSSNEKNSYVYCICDNKLRKLNYLHILRTIYCLLSGDTESKHQESENAMYYEEKIYRHVDRNGQVVKRRQGLPDGIVTDITDRAWKIYKIIRACKLLEGFRMVAFIGPENVGKTTLINSILGENVGAVGFTTHTSSATLYRFTNDIFIVDFPGTDAGGERAGLSRVWEYYEKFADLCIIVVNFGGDTSRAAENFLRIARWRMCENVVLVINRVDSVLNGSSSSPVWVEYSPSKVKQLRMSFAESCGLPIERVFLSVSRAREELEETTRHLLEERPSIIMKKEITRQLQWLLCEAQAAFF